MTPNDLPDRTPATARGPRVERMCVICGRGFLIVGNLAHRYATCSRTCSTARRKLATHRGVLSLTCARCSAEFTMNRSHLKGPRTGEYCSNSCRLEALNARPRPARTANCRTCGKEFRAPYSKPDSDGKFRGFYCSRLCMWSDDDYRKRRAVRHSPTRLEGWLFDTLDTAGVKYEKFGNVGRYVPDAMLTDYAVIIEVDGVMWHRARVEHDQHRDHDLAAAGWTVMHFTDIDLRSRPHAARVLGEAIDQIVGGEARYRPPTLWREDQVVPCQGRAAGDLEKAAEVHA